MRSHGKRPRDALADARAAIVAAYRADVERVAHDLFQRFPEKCAEDDDEALNKYVDAVCSASKAHPRMKTERLEGEVLFASENRGACDCEEDALKVIAQAAFEADVEQLVEELWKVAPGRRTKEGARS